MNPSPAFLNYGNSVLDFAQFQGLFPDQDYGSLSLTSYEVQAFGNTSYAISGGSFHPWDGAALLLDSIEWQKTADAETARAVEDAILAERNRLARELHDAVTQTLFAAGLIAEVLPDLWEMDETEARKSTEELRQLTRGALAEMRTLLFELHPAALNQARLSDLLRQLSEAVTGRKRLPICLAISGDCEIPSNVKVEMYRIVQESLNNVVKYARATQVEINVRLDPSHVHLEVKDNGLGFDPTCVKPTSMGLRIMRERAEAIQVSCTLPASRAWEQWSCSIGRDKEEATYVPH